MSTLADRENDEFIDKLVEINEELNECFNLSNNVLRPDIGHYWSRDYTAEIQDLQNSMYNFRRSVQDFLRSR